MNSKPFPTMHEASHGTGTQNSINLFDPVLSCIQPQIEQKSLQVSMESNRESLERRLQLRRTLPELVNQGIYPKLNTPLAFAEQSRQLEQAKARDLLQKKLKDRPDRQCLVQHHILEDTHPLVDRSLQDKQRLLKKSKLQDNLNDLLSHRPGPLDLVSKNILLLDDESVSMPEEPPTDNEDNLFSDSSNGFGMLFSGSFDATSFGSSFENVSPVNHGNEQTKHLSSGSFEFVSMDESNQLMYPHLSSPEDLFTQPSPERTGLHNDQVSSLSVSDQQHAILRQDIPPAPDITPLLMASSKQQCNLKTLAPTSTFAPPTISTTLTLGALPENLPLVTPASVASTSSAYRQQKSQKKIRTKSISKPKPIKFHEYKGPPNVVKSSQQSSSKNKQTQRQIDILQLQQEQMIKWQFTTKNNHARPLGMSFIAPKPDNRSIGKEHAPVHSKQAKILNAMSSDVQKNGDPENGQKMVHNNASICPATSANNALSRPSEPNKNPVDKTQIRLEDLKVPELRAECRKLNISCSGSKPQLIERLQMHRSASFDLSPTMLDSNRPSVKNEFSGYSDNATLASLSSMDVEMNAGNAFSTSNHVPVYSFGSAETNDNLLSSLQTPFSGNFSNIAHNACLNEMKSDAHQIQHIMLFNENKKIENENQFLSAEEKIKLSEEKIAKLERDLQKAQQEIKMKDQCLKDVMQLVLTSGSKPDNTNVQNARNGLMNQASMQDGTDQLQNNIIDYLQKQLLVLKNPQREVNDFRAVDVAGILQSQNIPALTRHLADLEQLLKLENASDQIVLNALIGQNISNQLEQAMLQKQLNRISTNREALAREVKSQHVPSFAPHSNHSLPSYVGMDFNTFSQKNSSSFSDLNSKTSLNGSSFLPFGNQFQSENQQKTVRDLNHPTSQNGTSVDSILKLWSMQNQSKSFGQKQQTHHQQLHKPQQQLHCNTSTIEEVLDVLRTKPEFSNICTPSQEHIEMDIFQGMNDPSPQDYDISFPLVMEPSTTGPCILGERSPVDISAADGVSSHDSKMRTPQPELELMDIFNGDCSTGNSFFTPIHQGLSNTHSLFSQNNSIGNHQHGMKNGCMDMLNDFDLASFSSASSI